MYIITKTTTNNNFMYIIMFGAVVIFAKIAVQFGNLIGHMQNI